MTRIYKIEKFIPFNGTPVIQVHEETTVGSQVIRLDPRNPSIEELDDEHDALILTLTTQLAAANARIETLLDGLPFDPRIIDATAFYNRLTKDELLVFVSSEDPQVIAIGKVIASYKSNDWPVVFESAEFQQMVGYLLESGVVTSERLAELTKDASRDEAYVAS
jgi:hypothetical protein